jgi:predicted unusual protein kinase regulating ubiquinone biosynthesis (AarF/ABC1/UbiB family)
MKVGQIVAYVDPSLPPELRTMLSLLQSQAPASPWSAVEQTLREDLGLRADALLPRMGRTPIAVASIGQVHRARLADGTELAVKIQHPGVANALRTDFNTATTGAVFARLMPGGSSVRGLIDEARTAMLEECDFTLEASRQRAFATFFANHSMLAIPHVIDATPRVLMTEWLPGRSLDAFLATNPRQVERDRIGTALFELFIGTLYRHGQLHADPHPGNFAIADDGRVVIYDFGCVRRFDPAVVAGLRDLLAAVRTDDLDAMAAGLEAIGGTAPSKPAVRDHMRTLLRSFFAPLLVDGPHAIDAGASLGASDVLADKRALLGLALPGSLLFLLRLRFGLYAVLARLGAIADWAALEHAYVIENDQVLPTMSLADPHALHRH